MSMLYARKGAYSDVLVFRSVFGVYHCACCDLENAVLREDKAFKTIPALLEHLRHHQQRGHRIPADCWILLNEELEGQKHRTPPEAPKS